MPESHPGPRAGHLAGDEFAEAAAQLIDGPASAELLDALEEASLGSLALAADAVAGKWTPELDRLPATVVEAIVARARAGGEGAMELVELLALAPELSVADLIGALNESIDPDSAERAARESGLLGATGEIAPLAREAVLADMTAARRGQLNDRIGVHLAPSRPALAANALLAGSGTDARTEGILLELATDLERTDPGLAIDLVEHGLVCGHATGQLHAIRTSAAFRDGSGAVAAYLDGTPAEHVADVAAIGFAMAIRDLRWTDASQAGGMHGALGAAFAGRFEVPPAPAPDDGEGRLLTQMIEAVSTYANGDPYRAVAILAQASDDYDRLGPRAQWGITPHALGAAIAINIGDSNAAVVLCDQALESNAGGEGEAITHRLLRAYAQLIDADFDAALELVRVGAAKGHRCGIASCWRASMLPSLGAPAILLG